MAARADRAAFLGIRRRGHFAQLFAAGSYQHRSVAIFSLSFSFPTCTSGEKSPVPLG